jgi:hypothetical protein
MRALRTISLESHRDDTDCQEQGKGGGKHPNVTDA